MFVSFGIVTCCYKSPTKLIVWPSLDPELSIIYVMAPSILLMYGGAFFSKDSQGSKDCSVNQIWQGCRKRGAGGGSQYLPVFGRSAYILWGGTFSPPSTMSPPGFSDLATPQTCIHSNVYLFLDQYYQSSYMSGYCRAENIGAHHTLEVP